MKVCLARHGIYSLSTIDPKEGLSEEGKEKVMAVRAILDHKGVSFDVVLSSTKERAMQTASLLANSAPITYLPELSPNGAAEVAFHSFPEVESLLVVSHLPILGDLAQLCGERTSFSQGEVIFFTGGQIQERVIS